MEPIDRWVQRGLGSLVGLGVVRNERLRELMDELRALKKRPDRADGTRPPGRPETPTQPAAAFSAKVLAVNGDVASVNAGSRRGVKAGMRLILFRQDKFVAFLKVSETDADKAAGIITDRKLDPMAGDGVMADSSGFDREAGRYRVWGIGTADGPALPKPPPASRAVGQVGPYPVRRWQDSEHMSGTDA